MGSKDGRSEDGLTAKHRAFCLYYLKLGNIREAAVKAGYFPPTAFIDGIRLLAKPEVRAYIERLGRTLGSMRTELVKQGLERLAFGEANDAVALACTEEPPSREELGRMDLFAVSEIKRVKGGGMEIKLFDRQKALERLWELENTMQTSQTAERFYAALQAGASAAGDEPDGPEDDGGGET